MKQLIFTFTLLSLLTTHPAAPASASAADLKTSKAHLKELIDSHDIRGLLAAVEMGANMNARSCDGETPINYALRTLNRLGGLDKWHLVLMLAIFIQDTTDLSIPHSDGLPPIHYAISKLDRFDIPMYPIMLFRVTEPNITDRNGDTILHAAMKKWSYQLPNVIPYFVACGARLDIPISTVFEPGYDGDLCRTSYMPAITTGKQMRNKTIETIIASLEPINPAFKELAPLIQEYARTSRNTRLDALLKNLRTRVKEDRYHLIFGYGPESFEQCKKIITFDPHEGSPDAALT